MNSKQAIGSSIIKLAAAIIIIAGLMSAKDIVVPILLAIFITILVTPLLNWLQKKGLNSSFALVGVVAILIIVMTLFGLIISASLHDFASNLPEYEAKLRQTLSNVMTFFRSQGMEFSDEMISDLIDPGKIAQFASQIVKGFGSALTSGLMLLLLIVFMLLEASTLSKKLNAIHVDALSHAKDILRSVKQYMMLKSLFSLLTGLLVYVFLLFIGLDYALLWGVLAFLLNFIPNIGSIIAAVPAVVLALIQLGFIGAIEVAVLFLVVNILIGSILEPKYMGRGLGLSALVVFVSLIFWGWVFGPIGMLLSVPLTIVLKLALFTNPRTKWIAILLGSNEV
jgi:predicted PurR-regulated permease PerM